MVSRVRLFSGLVVAAVIGATIGVGSLRIPTGSTSGHSLNGPAVPEHPSETLRLAVWNIHGGKGRDRRRDLDRVAASLRDFDFVGLNEVRAEGFAPPSNQAEHLAAQLRCGWLFLPVERRWGRDDFGNGVLSRIPVSEWHCDPLPATDVKGHGNLMQLILQTTRGPITILLTHVDRDRDHDIQLQTVIRRFLDSPAPVVLMGDLNSTAGDPQIRELLAAGDVADPLSLSDPPSPGDHIDWILVRGLKCVRAGSNDPGASDHPLIWAELLLEPR